MRLFLFTGSMSGLNDVSFMPGKLMDGIDESNDFHEIVLKTTIACITSDAIFNNPYSTIYRDEVPAKGITDDFNTPMGRIYHPRKYLTEQLNGSTPTNPFVMETLISMDYRVKRRNKGYKRAKKTTVVSYDADTEETKVDHYTMPYVGEEIKLVVNKKESATANTPNNLIGYVKAVYPLKIKVEKDGLMKTVPSYRYGVVDIQLTNYETFHRSIMSPHYHSKPSNFLIKII